MKQRKELVRVKDVTITDSMTETEHRYRALLDSTTGFAMLILAPDGRLIDCNAGALEILGECTTYEGAPADEIERDLAVAREIGRCKQDRWYTRRDGTRFSADIVVSAVRRAGGTLAYYIVIIRDVTVRKKALNQLRERALENTAVAAFGHKAVTERRPDVLHQAALSYLTAALQAGSSELLHTTDDEPSLELTLRVGGSGMSSISGGIHFDALERLAPVTRRLTERDYEAAPYLRGSAQYGIATAVECGSFVSVLAAFSNEHPFETQSMYPLQAIASMYAAAIVRSAAEEQLADRQNRLRLILEQMPAIVSTLNSDLVFTSTQGSGLAALGVEGFVGLSYMDLGIPEDSPPVIAGRAALRGLASRYEYTYKNRTYDNRVEPLRDRDGKITGYINLGVDITEYREAEAALRESREQLRRLTSAMHQVQENERRRIAREVHDELGQRLTALRLDLGLLRTELRDTRSDAVERRIATMFDLIDETIATVRRVAMELRPAILDDFGFRAAVENELLAFTKRTGIQVAVSFRPDDLTLDSDRATALYRIVQEALTNVARHSGATRAECTIELRDGHVHAEIRDNGRGITEAESFSRLGLIGVRERAYSFGGTAVIEGAPGAGTRVSVAIPT